MRIGIIGGGSIGLLVTTYLCREHHVTLYVRTVEQKQAINQSGVWLDPYTMSCPKGFLSSELQEEDCWIVCVKQHQLEGVLDLLVDGKTQAPVVFLQNGMAHVDQLHKLTSPVILGVVEHGAQKLGKTRVSHTGHGCLKLASYNADADHLKTLIENWHHDDFPIKFQEDWRSMLGEKLVVNAVVNPLTALFDITNGEMVKNGYIRTLAKVLCQEACQVLGFAVHEQWEKVERVANNTGENISSMLKDIHEQRPTEIDAITGFLIHHATIPIPYTIFIYNSIKAIEKKKEIGNEI